MERSKMIYKTIDEENIQEICESLASQDVDLRIIFEKYGTPPVWKRNEGFETLVHIILEQQVSLASAKACLDKLAQKIGKITPQNFVKLNDEELKSLGFSRQKTSYCRGLAEAILSKQLNLVSLQSHANDEVKDILKSLKGIGDWTADIYLLMAMSRADVMPKGDLALHISWRKLANLEKNPTSDEFVEMAEKWKPFRSVAARMLWHFYLSERKKTSK
jgi:DNA-3-methyladenine glycosylase II